MRVQNSFEQVALENLGEFLSTHLRALSSTRILGVIFNRLNFRSYLCFVEH